MDRTAALIATTFVGGLIAIQAPVNGKLGRAVGAFPAATVSFALGFLALLAIVVVKGEVTRLGEATSVPWWYLVGGVLGAAYITTVLVAIGTIGAGAVVACTVAAQLSISMIVDHFGWLGVERDPVTPTKIVGVVLLAAGVWLVVRE